MSKATAVEILSKKFPVSKNDIIKTSEKWGKRTKKLLTKWPREGTFDINMCDEMEVLIKNYKPKDKSETREQKRELEAEILKLFRAEGERLRKTYQTLRIIGKDTKEQEKQSGEKERRNKEPALYPDLKEIEKPPPYPEEGALKQCPIIKGTVDIEGEIGVWDDEEEIRDYRRKKETERRAMREEKERIKQEEREMEADLRRMRDLRVRRDFEEYLLYKRRTEQNEEESEQGGMEGNSLEEKEEKFSKEEEGIRDRREKKGKVEKRRKKTTPVELRWQKLEIETGSETDEESDGEESQSTQGKEGGMMPLLLKRTGQTQYVPWGTQDLEGLKNALPNIHEGAGKWIRAFEEETTGRLLAMGDLKALLVKVIGTSKLRELMELAGITNAVDNPMIDGVGFDRVRQRVWQALRNCYPLKMDPKALRGDPLGDTENPAAYLENQLKKWRLETEQEVEGNQVMTTMFRTAVVEAMPPQVKSRLEEVVGLTSISHPQFRDYLVHAVEKYRKDKMRLAEQQEEVQRKLAQMQLEELKKKEREKGKKMLPVTTDLVVTTEMSDMPAHNESYGGARQGPENPMPIINVFGGAFPQMPYQGQNKFKQQPRQDWSSQGGGQRGYGQKGPVKRQVERETERLCWGCNQSGHIKRDCPHKPWPATFQQESMGREQYFNQGPAPAGPIGPVNPYARY